MQTKKPSGLVTSTGLLKLIGHAAMGVAMGLALALILILMDRPGTGTAVDLATSQGFMVFVVPVALSFGIGATLTGVVFMMTEDN